MYELEGKEVTLEFLQGKAKEYDMDFDSYLETMKTKGLVEKTNDVAETSAPASSVTPALPQVPFVEAQNMESSSEDTSLEQPKVDTQSVAKQAVFESVPFSQQIGMVSENIFDMVTDLVTDKEERQETVEAVKNQFKNMPTRLKDTFTKSVPAFGLKAIQTVSADPLFSQSPEVDKFIIDKFKELEASQKLYKDTGEGIVSGVKQADASDFVSGVVGANLQMIETVLPAMLTGGASLPIQITAPMYVDYNTAKAKEVYGEDDPDAIDKLVASGQDEFAVPATLGMVASGLEFVGFKGISKYIMGQPGKGTMLAKLFLTGNKEGLTELGQSAIEEVNTAAAQGKSGLEITKAMADGLFSDKGLESYLNGFLGSTGMSAAGNTVNRAIRSDNASVRDVNSKINKIADLTYAKNQTKNKQVKDAITLDIQEAEQDLKTYITEKKKNK